MRIRTNTNICIMYFVRTGCDKIFIDFSIASHHHHHLYHHDALTGQTPIDSLTIHFYHPSLLVGLIVIYKALCFDVAQGQMNWAPNENRTHSCRFASQAC